MCGGVIPVISIQKSKYLTKFFLQTFFFSLTYKGDRASCRRGKGRKVKKTNCGL